MILNDHILFCRGGMSVERQLVSLKFSHRDLFYRLVNAGNWTKKRKIGSRLEPREIGQLEHEKLFYMK